MVVKWIVHLKDGMTYTNEDGKELWDYPNDQITSVERVVDGKVASIKKSELLHTFFQKTTASRDFSLFSGEVSPIVIEEGIVGCFLDGKDGPVRLELVIQPSTGNCKLIVIKVKEITKDGF